MPRALLDVRLAPLLLCAASGSVLAASPSADPDLDEAYDHVVGTMQTALDALMAERRLPVVG